MFKFKDIIIFFSCVVFTVISIAGYFAKQKLALAQTQINHYIRSGATGLNNGSDWNNAYTTLPANLIRGDVYYIADGDYGSYTFDDPISGSLTITVKKAIIPDHGTDAGWDNVFGDGQAVWSSWVIDRGYYIFDGITGSDLDSQSYGFHLKPTVCPLLGTSGENSLAFFRYDTTSDSGTEFRHIFFEGCGNTNPNVCSYGIKSNAALAENLSSVISNNLFSGHAVNLVLYHWSNTLVENNIFDSNWSGSVCHGEQTTFGYFSNNIIYRYNIHRNSAVGGLAVHGASGVNDVSNSDWKVYGNIFYGGSVALGVIGVADSGSTHRDVIKNWEVYNNTVYNVIGGGYGAGFSQGECTDTAYSSKVYNNIFANTKHPIFTSTNQSCVIHDYNSFNNCTWLGSSSLIPQEENIFKGIGDPFISSANNDFRLKEATNNGLALSSPFDKDFLGNTRGSDGVWDRGAYEYIQASPPLKGDFNSDSKVNDLDFTDFKNAFKSIFNSLFDLNSDNTIDVKDLGVLMSGWLP